MLLTRAFIRFPQFFHWHCFLFQDPIQDTMSHLDVTSPSSPPTCENFSHLPSVSLMTLTQLIFSGLSLNLTALKYLLISPQSFLSNDLGFSPCIIISPVGSKQFSSPIFMPLVSFPSLISLVITSSQCWIQEERMCILIMFPVLGEKHSRSYHWACC